MGMEGFIDLVQLTRYIDNLITHCNANDSSSSRKFVHQMIELSFKFSPTFDNRGAANLN
jgi:hypothetical protein